MDINPGINPYDNRAPNSTATATTTIRVTLPHSPRKRARPIINDTRSTIAPTYGLQAIHPSPISKSKKGNRGEAKLEASLPLAGASSSVTSAGAARKLNYKQDVDAVVDADAETNSAPDVEEYVSA